MIATYLLAWNLISYHLLHHGKRLSYHVMAAPGTFRDITNWLVSPKLLNKQINLTMNLNGNKSLFIFFIHSSSNGSNRIRREQEVFTFVELKRATFQRNRNSNYYGFSLYENTFCTASLDTIDFHYFNVARNIFTRDRGKVKISVEQVRFPN